MVGRRQEVRMKVFRMWLTVGFVLPLLVLSAMVAPAAPATTGDAVGRPSAVVDVAASRGQSASRADDVTRVYIPALGDQTWGIPVVPGVRDVQLDKGFGTYPFAVKPGQGGNFAIAGHRTTHLAPLLHVEKLSPGDRVIVRYRGDWYTYRLQAMDIVRPTAGWVVNHTPAPFAGSTPGAVAYLTMTTCHPPGSARLRWVWWGMLSSVRDASNPPAVITRRGA
jgi:sortase A